MKYACIFFCTVGGAFFLWRFYGRYGIKNALNNPELYFVLVLGLFPYFMLVWSHHVAGNKDPGVVKSTHKWLKESEQDA